jgi:hypothetical protein
MQRNLTKRKVFEGAELKNTFCALCFFAPLREMPLREQYKKPRLCGAFQGWLEKVTG